MWRVGGEQGLGRQPGGLAGSPLVTVGRPWSPEADPSPVQAAASPPCCAFPPSPSPRLSFYRSKGGADRSDKNDTARKATGCLRLPHTRPDVSLKPSSRRSSSSLFIISHYLSAGSEPSACVFFACWPRLYKGIDARDYNAQALMLLLL